MYYLRFDPITGEKAVAEKNIRTLERRKEKLIRKIS